MSRVNNKWENEESWTFHITNKNLMRDIIMSDDDEDVKRLSDIQLKDEWLVNQGEGDPPNMAFIRNTWDKYWEYTQKKGIPIFERLWLERSGRFVVSLYRQDSAYAERIGGVIQWIIYNEKSWKKCRNKKQRIEFIRDCMEWWNENDQRDRTRTWIQRIWDKVLVWYEKKEFWEHSINFLINYVVEHKGEWQSNQMYDPAVWFPRGRGQINNFVHGGVA